MGKIAALISALSFLSVAIFGSGVTGADILKADTGVRAIGLGSAYTAAGNDVESINFNPAGIVFVSGRDVKAYYVKNYAGSLNVELYNISFAQPLETSFLEGTIALEATYLGLPTISNPDATDPGVSFNDLLIKAVYAVNAAKLSYIPWSESKYLNLGIAAGMVFEQLGTFSGSSVMFDLGSQFVLYDTGFMFGAALQNIGTPIKYISEASPLPLTLRLGASYDTRIDKHNIILVSMDYIQDFYDYARFAAGVEDNILNLFYLRAGYNTSIDTRNASYISAGAGLTVKLLETTLAIDYTFRLQFWNGFNGSQQSQLVGIGAKF
jgi:hypothetical protein